MSIIKIVDQGISEPSIYDTNGNPIEVPQDFGPIPPNFGRKIAEFGLRVQVSNGKHLFLNSVELNANVGILNPDISTSTIILRFVRKNVLQADAIEELVYESRQKTNPTILNHSPGHCIFNINYTQVHNVDKSVPITPSYYAYSLYISREPFIIEPFYPPEINGSIIFSGISYVKS